MDYEKKYNDALNLAKSYYGKGCNEFLDTIFPELAESEDERNERIRKAIVHLLEVASEAYLIDATGFKKEQFLSYLERQKDPNQESGVYTTEQVDEKIREAQEWKPSEEQIEVLKRVFYNRPIGSDELSEIESLYNDLKKLGVKEKPEYYQHFDTNC